MHISWDVLQKPYCSYIDVYYFKVISWVHCYPYRAYDWCNGLCLVSDVHPIMHKRANILHSTPHNKAIQYYHLNTYEVFFICFVIVILLLFYFDSFTLICQGCFIGKSKAAILFNELEHYTFEITASSSRGQWVNVNWSHLISLCLMLLANVGTKTRAHWLLNESPLLCNGNEQEIGNKTHCITW